MKYCALVLLASLATGCGAADSAGTNGSGSWGGSSGGGGKSNGGTDATGGNSSVVSKDAGWGPADAGTTSDGSAWLPTTMNGTVPPFDWDAGSAGNKGGANGSAGSSGTVGGSGGSSGGKSSGGATSSGGASSSGGSAVPSGGAGGAGMGGRGGSAAGGSAGNAASGGSGPGDGGAGGSPSADAGVGGAGGWADGGAPCTARIRALRPVSLDHLVAGPHVQIVLRAERDGTGTGAWSWYGLRDRTASVPVETGRQDTAAATFLIDRPGSYVFTASDNAGCLATITASAKAADACTACNQGAIVRASAPPSTQIPVQTGYVSLSQNVVPQTGVQVQVGPSVGRTLVDAYVRILCDSETVADGLSDLRNLFTTRLLSSRPSGTTVKPLQYNVLVVPADGTGSGTIGATAPQLYRNLAPSDFASTNFQLVDGVAITGTTHLNNGDTLTDARWVLSNQGPAQKASGDLLFSSVGRSDGAGSFRLNAQPGTYWVTISPPAGRGLPEAISAAPVAVGAGTTLDFTWAEPITATVNLTVQDARGQALPNALVRLSTAEAQSVGQLHVHGTTGDKDIQAHGSTRLEATTSSAGLAIFTGVPANVSYNVVIVPEVLGPAARTTVVPLRVTPGSFSTRVSAQAEAHITGRLATNSNARALDLSQVTIVATDKTDEAAEPIQSVRANAEGHFDLAVTPGRVYVLMAIPPSDSDYARTFLDPGPMMASEFPIAQTLFRGLPWKASVLAQNGQPLSGTALQMFCDANWPNCIDSTIALAETTAASDGTFAILLPDPTTR
jgi:hypothetical protein